MKAKTAKIWARRVAEWRASGLTSTEFSAGREFSAGGLRHWACRLRKAAAATVPATLVVRTSKRRRVAPRQVVRLARVVARPAGLAKEPEKRARDLGPLAEHGVGRGGIALEVGRVRIAVERGFDGATLAAVLAVLGAGGES